MKQPSSSRDSKKNEMPWRMVQYKPKRSGKRGVASAQVKILRRWYDISIELDIEGFRALTELPELSRYRLLDSLATMPVRSGELDEKRGGIRDPMAVVAKENAQWLGPLFLYFYQKCALIEKRTRQNRPVKSILTEMEKTRLYGKILSGSISDGGRFVERLIGLYRRTQQEMNKDSQIHRTPHGMAAYIIEKRWCQAYKQWPKSLHPPTVDSPQFFKILKRNNPYTNPIIPKLIPDLVEDVLAGREPVIFFPQRLIRPRQVTMTWF